MRRRIMAGNWKMYKSATETAAYLRTITPLIAETSVQVVIFPPFVNLAAALEAAHSTNIEIGAQDLFWLKEGAYTGEVSAPMLASLGCRWVIVGHSERRQYFGDTDDTVLKKTVAALDAGLTPIVCVGEHLEQRESGAPTAYLAAQFACELAGLTAEQFTRVVIAYEPVWAIGTGRTATPQIAAEMHAFVRGQIREKFGDEVASSCRILYGGSVKPENIAGLMAEPELDG